MRKSVIASVCMGALLLLVATSAKADCAAADDAAPAIVHRLSQAGGMALDVQEYAQRSFDHRQFGVVFLTRRQGVVMRQQVVCSQLASLMSIAPLEGKDGRVTLDFITFSTRDEAGMVTYESLVYAMDADGRWRLQRLSTETYGKPRRGDEEASARASCDRQQAVASAQKSMLTAQESTLQQEACARLRKIDAESAAPEKVPLAISTLPSPTSHLLPHMPNADIHRSGACIRAFQVCPNAGAGVA